MIRRFGSINRPRLWMSLRGVSAITALVLSGTISTVVAYPGVAAADTSTSLIVNGDFETGVLSGWSSSGVSIGVSTTAHSGSFAAMLGSVSPTAGDSSITQTFTVPSGAQLLRFWYLAVCPDTVKWDWATASLKDNTTSSTTTLLAPTCTNTGTWTQVAADVSALAGHSLTLSLTSHDDDNVGDATYTLYDDVSLDAITPPAAPTNLSAVAISSSEIALSWADDPASTATYSVERSADGTSWGVLAANLPGATTNYGDTTASPGATYSYRVRAANTAGSSDYSGTAPASTPAGPAPVASDSFSRSASNGWGSPDLGPLGSSWQVSLGSPSAFSVGPDSSGSNGAGKQVASWSGQSSQAILPINQRDASATFRLASDGQPVDGNLHYYVYLRYLDANDFYRAGLIVTPGNAMTVTLDVATGGSTGSDPTTLAWQTLSGLTFTPGVYYHLRFETQSTSATATTVRVKCWPDGTPEPASFQLTYAGDTTPLLQGPGSLGLLSYLGAEYTGPTPVGFYFDNVAVTPLAPPLPAPTALAATACSASHIALSWTNNAPSATAYEVDRSPDNSNWTVVTATLPVGATSFTDSGLSAMTPYYYRVRALGGSGASPYSTSLATQTNSLLVTDSFTRTVAGAWGTPDITDLPGLSWAATIGPSSALSVGPDFTSSSGAGKEAVPAAGSTRQASLPIKRQNVSVTVRVAADQVPVNRNYNGYIYLRYVDDFNWYRLGIVMTPTGTIWLELGERSGTATAYTDTTLVSQPVTDLTYKPLTYYSLRFDVQDSGGGSSSLSGKIWADGTAEPATFQVTSSDATPALQTAGSLGLRAYASSNNTGVYPADLYWDDLRATTLTPN